VIAGQARGARLKSPRGVHIRPMMDRVRGALFNMIAAQGGPGERVLDLYAGTGAVGIEALSRGAVAADFVDNHPRCCRTIQENLIAAGMKGRGRVFRRRADRVLTRPALLALPSGDLPTYDLVSVTPPYSHTDFVEVLHLLAKSGLVGAGATVVVEHARTFEMPDQIDRLSRVRQRRYGATVLTFYSLQEELSPT